jgi:hypothetical protein
MLPHRPKLNVLLPILTDIENQWDLYLANTYQIKELRSRSFEDERFPVDWFQDRLSKVKALHGGRPRPLRSLDAAQ